MTQISNNAPVPMVPAAPVVAPAAPVVALAAPALEAVAEAAHAHQEAPMAPAQLGALDTMMQAFLADGKLDAAEQQAYVASRAAFTGGWESVPLPADDDAAPAPAAVPAPASAAVPAPASAALPAPASASAPAPAATPAPAAGPARAARADEYMPNYAFDVAVGDEKSWLPDEAGAMAAYMGITGDRSRWPEVIAACRANHPGAMAIQAQQHAEQLAAEAAEGRVIYQGAMPAGFNPTMEDLNYLHQMRDAYLKAHPEKPQGGSAIYYDVLTGSHLQHSQWINQVEGMAVDDEMYKAYVAKNGPLVAVLQKLMHPGA
ncbi:MAG: hypothetical protein JWM80_2214 [Cyanobacteria bacterium RYN_339]|nr:hypothetical protein [Cyanobacteria bacterium RYN_339]